MKELISIDETLNYFLLHSLIIYTIFVAYSIPAASLLTIVAGFLFIWHGAQKFFNFLFSTILKGT